MTTETVQKASKINSSPTIADQATDILRDMIQNGAYGPGVRINEVELSKQMGISRGPIREAIQRLVKESILYFVPRKGAYANFPSNQEINHLFEVREVLEVLSVDLASQRMTSLEANEITNLLNNVKPSILKNDYDLYPWDFDFHNKIAESTKNLVLKNQLYEINGRLELVRKISGYKQGRAINALHEHTAILEAVIKGDATLAKDKMQKHIKKAKVNFFRIAKEALNNFK